MNPDPGRSYLRRRFDSCVHLVADFLRAELGAAIPPIPKITGVRAQKLFAYKFDHATIKIEMPSRVGDLVLMKSGKQYHLGVVSFVSKNNIISVLHAGATSPPTITTLRKLRRRQQICGYFRLADEKTVANTLAGIPKAGGPVLGIVLFFTAVAVTAYALSVWLAPDVEVPDFNRQQNSGSPTYSLHGGSNQQRPFDPLPIHMGKHKFFPDSLAPSVSLYYRDNSQKLLTLLGYGYNNDYGNIGLITTNIKAGDTPIKNFHAGCAVLFLPENLGLSVNIQTALSPSTPAFFAQSLWGIYSSTLTQEGAKLTAEGDISFENIIVEREYSIDRDRKNHRFQLNFVGRLFDTEDDGDLRNVTVQAIIQWRAGVSGAGGTTWNDWIEFSPDTGLLSSSWKQQTGLYTEPEGGRHNVWFGNGSVFPAATAIFGSYTKTWHFEGSTRSTMRRSLFSSEVNLPAHANRFAVRCAVIEVSGGNDIGQRDLSWESLTVWRDDSDANYQKQSRIIVALEASATLSGRLEQVNQIIFAKTHVWNGQVWSDERVTTSNPAAWFRFFVKGDTDSNGKLLYGLGLSESEYDEESIEDFFEHCYKFGWRFDAVIDRKQRAHEVLQNIVRAGLGMMTFKTGRLGVVVIEPFASPAAIFDERDLLEDSLAFNFSVRNRNDGVKVVFRNEEKDFEQDEIEELLPGVSVIHREERIDLFGVVSPVLVRRFAKMQAAQLAYGWTCEFEISPTRIDLDVGDVVGISHPMTGGVVKKILITELRHSSNERLRVSARYHGDELFAPLLEFQDAEVHGDIAIASGHHFHREVLPPVVSVGTADLSPPPGYEATGDFGSVAIDAEHPLVLPPVVSVATIESLRD